MMPGIDGIDGGRLDLGAKLTGQSLGNAVYTAYGRYNPYLVAHTYITVLTYVSLEGSVSFLDFKLLVYRTVCVFKRSREIGLQIVLVDPFSGFHILAGMSDGVAVFDDILTLHDIAQQHLVACRYIFGKRNAGAVNFDDVAFLFLY